MKLRDLKFLVETKLMHAADVSITLDRPSLTLLINEAMQFVYKLALRADQTFYTRSAPFGLGTQIAHPVSYGGTLFIEVPAATAGAARIVSHREFLSVQNNPYVMGTVQDPLAVINTASFTVQPASTGTHYFLFTFPDITDDNADISLLGTPTSPAVIPWMYQELIINQAMILAATREAMKPETPESDSKKYMMAADEAKKALAAAMTPLAIFKQEIPTAK